MMCNPLEAGPEHCVIHTEREVLAVCKSARHAPYVADCLSRMTGWETVFASGPRNPHTGRRRLLGRFGRLAGI